MTLRTTALTAWHQANDARLVDFAGWSMPLQYDGVMVEHRAVRTACGLFDVSHMAELALRGEDARDALDRLVTNNVGKLAVGSALYTALCNQSGAVLDDLLVYALAEDHFLVVANAANHQKVLGWFRKHLPDSVELRDETEATALMALQGPQSRAILTEWPALDAVRGVVDDLDYYQVTQVRLHDHDALVARTGYTGEWGYEIYAPEPIALRCWNELLEVGGSHGLVPAGLAARDTLRLEAGFALYGNDLGEDATPYESGIGWVVKTKKASDFVGKDALLAQREAGVPRRSVALRGTGRNIARPGARVFHQGEDVGEVTSGTFSPTLQVPIALARVAAEAKDGPLEVDVRGKRYAMEVVSLPFVPSHVRG